jgi:hypothetical protein
MLFQDSGLSRASLANFRDRTAGFDQLQVDRRFGTGFELAAADGSSAGESGLHIRQNILGSHLFDEIRSVG